MEIICKIYLSNYLSYFSTFLLRIENPYTQWVWIANPDQRHDMEHPLGRVYSFYFIFAAVRAHKGVSLFILKYQGVVCPIGRPHFYILHLGGRRKLQAPT